MANVDVLPSWMKRWVWNLLFYYATIFPFALQWRRNKHDSVSNHQRLDCLLNRLFRRRSKKTSKLRATSLYVRGIHRWLLDSPHKGPVTRKMFPFHDVIIINRYMPEAHIMQLQTCRKYRTCIFWTFRAYVLLDLVEYLIHFDKVIV